MKSTRTLVTLAAVIFAVQFASGQTFTQGWRNQTVVFAGNSIAQFQGYIANHDELTLLPSSNVLVHGHNSYQCWMILQQGITHDVPASTSVVLLFNSTDDVERGIAVQSHMTCMQETIQQLIEQNASVKILVANTPPWTSNNLYGDFRVPIAQYNAAYADPDAGLQAQFPHNVRVVDVYSPNADGTQCDIDDNGDPILSECYAIQSHMTGPDGIHPGPADIWQGGWIPFSPVTTSAIYSALQTSW